MKKITILLIAFMFVCAPSYAQGPSEGTYKMDSGSMKMTLNIKILPDGKYFLDGMGSSSAGKNCRIGDLAELRGNELVMGVCKMTVSASGNKLELQDSGKCAQCDAGASISGTYLKQ